MKEYQVITKIRLCKYLLSKGFVFEETRMDYANPKYVVWVFKNSEDLQNAITEYYNEWKAQTGMEE